LGIGDWAQSPIPNPQSPIPNPQKLLFVLKLYKLFYFSEYINQYKFLKIKLNKYSVRAI
jgi:hypothetical protein